MQRTWLIRLLLSALIIGACGVVISTYHYFRHTWDEPEHLAAGIQLLDKHLYTYDQQHPPLARLAMAIGPYLAGARSFGEPGPSGEQEGRDLLYRTGKYTQLLTLARLGTLPFLVVLLLTTWAWAKHVHGVATGFLALILLIATPPILGHAGVAALDVPGAALCTLALYCLLRWFETPSWPQVFYAGIAAGLAIGTKLSGLPFIAVVAAAWLLAAWWQQQREGRLANRPSSRRVLGSLKARWLAQVGCMVAIALFVTMLCYGYSFDYLVDAAHPYNAALSYVFGRSGWSHDIAHGFARYVPLPVGLEGLIYSIQELLKHNNEGHLSYLLGEFSKTGFRQFYVVAIAVKTPLPLLMLSLAGLILLGWQASLRGWIVAAPTIAFVVLLVFCSFYSHINIGLRHVFVLYPLLCIAAAALAVQVWQRYTQAVIRGGLAALLAWQVSSLWTEYPDYLPYFNFIAGDHPEKMLIDSDLDWGQDLQRLEMRLTELHVKKFGFVYRGSADVVGEHLPGVWMVQPFNPGTGWIAASLYARDTVSQGKAFEWLKRYRPLERIGKTIDLYYIPEKSGK
jgi:hypothetical protein